MPPFSPGPPLMDCSCGIPGCGGGETRTARTFCSIGLHDIGDVKDAADECSLDRAEGLAVQPHAGLIVDAFEGEGEMASATQTSVREIRRDTSSPAC